MVDQKSLFIYLFNIAGSHVTVSSNLWNVARLNHIISSHSFACRTGWKMERDVE